MFSPERLDDLCTHILESAAAVTQIISKHRRLGKHTLVPPQQQLGEKIWGRGYTLPSLRAIRGEIAADYHSARRSLGDHAPSLPQHHPRSVIHGKNVDGSSSTAWVAVRLWKL
jgi:hypothetical protein